MEQSVILCCHNSATRLPETLRHLAAQQLPHDISWEIVLVDNTSTDGTAEIAETLWAGFGAPAPLRIVAEPTPGLAYARRAGVLATDSPVVVFCDDDNWLAPDYLSRSHAILAGNSRIGAVGGHSTAVFEGDSAPEWFEAHASAFAVGRQAPASGDVTARGYLWGAGLSVRGEALRRIHRAGAVPLLVGRAGGQALSGDDSEICKWLVLMRLRLHYDEDLRLRHFVPAARQSLDYLSKIQDGFRNAHPTLSAYQAYADRQDSLRRALTMHPSAFVAAFRNEAKILLRGWRVHRNVRRVKRLTLDEGLPFTSR